MKVSESVSLNEISDLSPGGCFIKLCGPFPETGEKVRLSFKFAGKTYKVAGKVAWQNRGSVLSRGHGIGVAFTSTLPQINRELSFWLYDESTDFSKRKLSTEPSLRKSIVA